MIKQVQKSVHPELSYEQKCMRTLVCCDHIKRFNNESFFDRLTTCGEKWVVPNNRKRGYV
ncbi:hypothetical protein M514_01813 [Trichuris suis]|uniref:Uncharacterized protein n=1 Tax=Trichuris suis TaxID=68888 RepID=A0A085NT90_9BILA|nr:hypothetical protein M513_01813 [Trichuris suis]KFD72686.1 hypothetical protein M514_01813 [Trichuris suis]